MALKVDQTVLGETHHDLGVDHNILGILYYQKGNNERATHHLHQAKKVYVFTFTRKSPVPKKFRTPTK